MTERIFRSSGNWALGADTLQWILYKRRPRGNFVGISFVGSSRDILARCLQEAGCAHTDATKLLAGLPSTFDAWKRLQNAPNEREMATDAAVPQNEAHSYPPRLPIGTMRAELELTEVADH